ncbi:predicted protein [Naegleria gruberi]|uniref:Predicted protein n=1 Tax=Naegleria gruberi TaxID=5762 RepID=D2UZM8_NAEGR|nr:uncharacterized protein NAEGRDRAFT_61997 [Naegleria gruberi]EFC50186.1 predicted protein [Naegleria gruberi]|eukprot:XP_002682930.1 predicted protein [Naegleria gruberi strain NEG-M]
MKTTTIKQDINEIAEALNKHIQHIDELVREYENNFQMIRYSSNYQQKAINPMSIIEKPSEILKLLQQFERRQGVLTDHALFSQSQAKTLRWILSQHELFIFSENVKNQFFELLELEVNNELSNAKLENLTKITVKKDDIILNAPYTPDWERGGKISFLGTLGYSKKGFSLIFYYLDSLQNRKLKIENNPIREITIDGEYYLEIDLKRCLSFKNRSIRMIGFLALRRYISQTQNFTDEIVKKQIEIVKASHSNSFFHLYNKISPEKELEELEKSLKSLQEKFIDPNANLQLTPTQLWDWNLEMQELASNSISENFKISTEEGITGICKIIEKLFGYIVKFDDDLQHVTILRNERIAAVGILDLVKNSKPYRLNTYLYHGCSEEHDCLNFSIIESFEIDQLSIQDLSQLFQHVCKAVRHLIIKEENNGITYFGEIYLNNEWSLIIDHFLDLLIRDPRIIFGIFRPLLSKQDNSKEILYHYMKSREHYLNTVENFHNQEKVIQDMVNIKIQSSNEEPTLSYFDMLNSESNNLLPIYNKTPLHKFFAVTTSLCENQASLGRRNVINEFKYKQFANLLLQQFISSVEDPLSDRQVRNFMYRLFSIRSNTNVFELMRRILPNHDLL